MDKDQGIEARNISTSHIHRICCDVLTDAGPIPTVKPELPS